MYYKTWLLLGFDILQSDKFNNAVIKEIVLLTHFDKLELYCKTWLLLEIDTEQSVMSEIVKQILSPPLEFIHFPELELNLNI